MKQLLVLALSLTGLTFLLTPATAQVPSETIDVIHTFTIEETTGVNRNADTIVWGVPIKQGLVSDPAKLALFDQQGKQLPCQVDVSARWNDDSIKWILATIPKFDLAAKATTRVQLVLTETTPPAGMSLQQNDHGVTVVTDRIRFTIEKQGSLVPLLERRVEGHWQKRAVGLDLAMTVEHEGKKSNYLASRAEREIIVEQAGPLRSLIAVKGNHRSADGRTFGPYTLRFEILAQSSQIRLTHSFIYDGDPQTDFVRASEVLLSAVVGGQQRFGFGGDEGHEVRFVRQRVEFMPDFRYAELYQDSVSHWRVRRWVNLKRREIFCEEGLHNDGWMELSGTDGRVAVAVGDFWQNHPKTMFADAKTGLMRIGLYPDRADRLNLQRYSDYIYTWSYESPAFDEQRIIPFRRQGAHGIRKTHDMLLMFDEPNPSARALFYNEPLRLQWAPAYSAETKIVVPAATQLDPQWLMQINEYLDFLRLAMLRDGGTGYIDYFDLPHGFNVEEKRWHHDFGGWGYLNNEAMPCLGLWQGYLLTGRNDVFKMAKAMTRHNSDIDSYHLGKDAGHGVRHNINHWGGSEQSRVSQPPGKRFLYYMTGDRSVLDLVAVMMEMWPRKWDRLQDMQLCCDVPALVSMLLVADETGMADAEPWLIQIADALAASVDETGQLNYEIRVDGKEQLAKVKSELVSGSYQMISAFGALQTFPELAERLDHQPLRDALVRFARFQALDSNQRLELGRTRNSKWTPLNNDAVAHRSYDLFAYAYTLTGDKIFLDRERPMLKHRVVTIESMPEARYGFPKSGNRLVPVNQGFQKTDEQTSRILKKYYGMFDPHSSAQHFNMAIYLHKAQGLMILADKIKNE